MTTPERPRCSEICRRLLSLQQRDVLCDLSLRGSDGDVMAHAVVMATSSPLVASHVESVKQGSRTNQGDSIIIRLHKHKATIIQKVVEMCYLGNEMTSSNPRVTDCMDALGIKTIVKSETSENVESMEMTPKDEGDVSAGLSGNANMQFVDSPDLEIKEE